VANKPVEVEVLGRMLERGAGTSQGQRAAAAGLQELSVVTERYKGALATLGTEVIDGFLNALVSLDSGLTGRSHVRRSEAIEQFRKEFGKLCKDENSIFLLEEVYRAATANQSIDHAAIAKIITSTAVRLADELPPDRALALLYNTKSIVHSGLPHFLAFRPTKAAQGSNAYARLNLKMHELAGSELGRDPDHVVRTHPTRSFSLRTFQNSAEHGIGVYLERLTYNRTPWRGLRESLRDLGIDTLKKYKAKDGEGEIVGYRPITETPLGKGLVLPSIPRRK